MKRSRLGAQHGYEWCFDSGTNRFITNDKSDFVPGSIIYRTSTVNVGSGTTNSPMVGTVMIKSLDNDCIIKCTNVLYLPDCALKLMPACKFTHTGCSISMTNNVVKMKSKDDKPMMNGREFNGLFFYHCETMKGSNVSGRPVNERRLRPVNSKMSGLDAPKKVTSNESVKGQHGQSPEGVRCADHANQSHFGLKAGKQNRLAQGHPDFGKSLLESHWAFGHLNFKKLRKLLSLGSGDDPDCAACTIAKSRRQQLSKNKYNRSTRCNHRMHLDLGFTRNSSICFQLVVDDYSRYSWIDILNKKSDAFESFQDLQRNNNNEYAPYSLAAIRTDSEPLYTAHIWENYCKKEGVEHEFSARYKHDANGVAESAMKAVGTPFRCVMIQGNAPEADSEYALVYCNVIRNDTPTKANNGWTPREKVAGRKLPINKRLLKGPLFCLVFAHVYSEERRKHEPRVIPSVYLCYDPTSNNYLIKEWASGKIYYTADLTWHPTRFPYRADPQRPLHWLPRYDDLAPIST